MKITYIAHSCFIVELDRTILLFDYYKGELPELPPGKSVFVFSSHSHADHFNLDIFSLMEEYPDTCYVFSNDIRRKYSRNFFLKHDVPEDIYDNKVTFLPDGCQASVGDVSAIRVETLKSTDEGVAFIVTVEGKTIYHAGDLHWWAWAEESAANNAQMEADYKKEIDSIEGRHFDAAFVVLDPRQEPEYFYKGLDYFMRHTDTDIVYPMHFWDDDRVIDRIIRMDVSAPYRDRIARTR